MAMLDATVANLALESIRADLAASSPWRNGSPPDTWSRLQSLCRQPRGWAAAMAMAASGRYRLPASSSHPFCAPWRLGR
jgi:hypothetical protein